MKERLIELVQEYALEEGECTLRSGIKVDYKLDCRKISLHPEGLRTIVNMLWKKMMPLKFSAIGGPCVGADPVVGGLVYRASMCVGPILRTRGFLVRKSKEDHDSRIAGDLQENDKVVIIEDVTTTGQTTIEAIDYIEGLGCQVVKVFSVVDRLSGAAEAFLARGIPFEPLLTTKDLGLSPKDEGLS
jgi:orotate phosphoribosyltransferase